MCGIIGRVSVDTNCVKTLKGLKELEYRGYDSFGIYLFNRHSREDILVKDIGEFDVENTDLINFKSNIEIGHTRWATHGKVDKSNAHPHFDNDKKFFIVMNGIVENYIEVKKFLTMRGYEFNSDTDTEVIPALYSFYYEDLGDVRQSLIQVTKKVLSMLKGEFSYLVKFDNFVLGYKNINPIIVGKSKDEVLISSDLNLVQNNSKDCFILEDEEFFISEYNSYIHLDFYDKDFNEISKESSVLSKVDLNVEKDTKYFMEKEIYEQRNLVQFLTDDNLNAIRKLVKKLNGNDIVLSAAGTSYNACLYLHYTLLDLGINSQIVVASELKNYINVIKNKHIIVFSQSGETADLIYPLKELKESNEIFTITNVRNSTLDRMASDRVYLNCGKEVAVASTKAFVFSMFFSKVLKSIYCEDKVEFDFDMYEKEFDCVFSKNIEIIDKICDRFYDVHDFFFIGRDGYFPLAIESALKLKEISYIHAEGFAGGELKHGSLALVEEGTPVVCLGDSQEIISNAIEIKTRGGVLIGASKGVDIFDFNLNVGEKFKDIFIVVLLQMLAFKMAVKRGLNPDKPRNLAKSVTVK